MHKDRRLISRTGSLTRPVEESRADVLAAPMGND
jgi:hypothetical protein